MISQKKTVAAVILAAGLARRMGRPKQLLPWGNETILSQTVHNVLNSQIDDVTVVSGAYRAEVEAEAARCGVPVVFNPDYAGGEMLSSLQVGVRLLLTRPVVPDGMLVMLGDLPFIVPTLIDQVVGAFRERPESLIAPHFDGRRGHPVIIGRSLFEELLALPAAGAPRDLFRKYPEQVFAVSVDSDVICKDIDTWEQYEKEKPKRVDHRPETIDHKP